MHVLLVENSTQIPPHRWPELKRLGRLHFDGSNGQPEVYLELPHPRRQTAADYKQMLPGIGIQVSGAYRDFPAISLDIPLSTLSWIQLHRGHGRQAWRGELASVPSAGFDCPWCGSWEFRGGYVVRNREHPAIFQTELFCRDCRLVARFDGKWDKADWPMLAAYAANAPRLPVAPVPERAWQSSHHFTPRQRRALGFGSAPQKPGLVGGA